MRINPYALAGICFVVTTAAQAATEPPIGRFQGTGRACYGTLDIKAKTISWMTPFSQCKPTPYEIVEQSQQDGQTRTAVRLRSHTGSCRYAVLTLTHQGPEKDTGWEVTGYGSQQSYQADKSSGYKANVEDMVSCTLIRD